MSNPSPSNILSPKAPVSKSALPTPLRFDLGESKPVEAQFHLHDRSEPARWDIHYELELGVVLSGRMERRYGSWATALEPGGIWSCGIWEPHGYRILKAPCEVAVFLAHPSLFLAPESVVDLTRLPFSHPPEARPQPATSTAPEIVDLCRRIRKRLKCPNPDTTRWLPVFLWEIVYEWIRDWDGADEAPAPSNSVARPWLKPALEIALSSRKLTTVATAARACGMGRNRFAESFRRQMGISFAQFALRRRLKGAYREYADDLDPLKAIAPRWGFTDASHFHHAFLRSFGVSPRQYKRREGNY